MMAPQEPGVLSVLTVWGWTGDPKRATDLRAIKPRRNSSRNDPVFTLWGAVNRWNSFHQHGKQKVAINIYRKKRDPIKGVLTIWGWTGRPERPAKVNFLDWKWWIFQTIWGNFRPTTANQFGPAESLCVRTEPTQSSRHGFDAHQLSIRDG